MAGELEWVVRGGGQGVMEIYPNTCIIMPPPHAQIHKHDVILKFHEFMQSLFYLFYGSGALGVPGCRRGRWEKYRWKGSQHHGE